MPEFAEYWAELESEEKSDEQPSDTEQEERLGELEPEEVLDEAIVKAFVRLLIGKNVPTEAEASEALDSLQSGDEDPFLRLIGKLQDSGGFAGELGAVIESDLEKFTLQKARYDGDLQGTEIGMVLFYCDLLAKLWTSVDYGAPKSEIPGFKVGPDGGNPSIYKKEVEENSATRIWFGIEKSAFQLNAANTRLWFARNATRIFSASSDPLKPGVEVPTTFGSERVMGWWNDHYEEVARFEPQYERLNGYMKWSTIVTWLRSKESHRILGFLENVDVNRTAWFPDWAEENADLRYKDWARVGFFEKGYKGVNTEAMPILKSRSFGDYGSWLPHWQISGGVGGTTGEQISKQPRLSANVEQSKKLSLRGVEAGSVEGGSFKYIGRGTEHTFSHDRVQGTLVHSQLGKSQRLRSRDADIAPVKILRSTKSEGRTQKIATRIGEVDQGMLSIERSQNGFGVNYTCRDLDRARSIARDLSHNTFVSPEKYLVRDPRVDLVIESMEGSFLVKSRGSEKWFNITAEGEPSAALKPGWDFRVSDSSSGAKRYQVAWMEDTPKLLNTENVEILEISLNQPSKSRPLLRPSARGPPLDRVVKIDIGGKSIPATSDQAGRTLRVKTSDLPKGLETSSEEIVQFVDSIPPASFRQGKTTISIPADRVHDMAAIDRFIQQGRHSEALTEIRRLGRDIKDPRLLLRRAIAEAGRGRIKLAKKFAEDSGLAENSTVQSLREVNRQLSGATGIERDVLRFQARHTVHKKLVTRGATKSVLYPRPRGASYEAVCELPTPPQYRPADVSDLTNASRIYVHDSLTLDNLDWRSTSQRKTIQGVLAANRADLVRIHQPDLGLAVSPDTIVYGSIRLRLSGRGAAVALGTLISVSLGGSGGDPTDDEESTNQPPPGDGVASRPGGDGESSTQKANVETKATKAPSIGDDDEEDDSDYIEVYELGKLNGSNSKSPIFVILPNRATYAK